MAMDSPDSPYVQLREGVWYVGASGVGVYSVVAMWQQGYSPEEIQASFPSLTLRQIYGTILYYLEHGETLDAFFREQDTLFRARKAEAEAPRADFYDESRARIARERAACQGTRSSAAS